MASLATACRLSARLTARGLRQDARTRGLRTSAACLAAQSFTMPALSPTMTEGNIAKWNLKEGDSFSAGDVLLEIETDKASMDVEAQDDGILAKIVQGDGSKGIKVGTRIGVLAEEGDDLSSLEIPAEDSAAPPAPKQEASKPSPEKTSESKPSAPALAKKSGEKAKPQTRPLLPSVEHLIHEHGLDASAIENMTPSGPNNRLLKGDVLAYLGSIASSYPSELSTKISKLSHLDLSNIKIAPPAPAAKSAKPEAPKQEPKLNEITRAISLKALLDVGLPVEAYVKRAAFAANDGLPRPSNSPDVLFDLVLGGKDTKLVRRNFVPKMIPKPISPVSSVPSKKLDIIDILAGGQTTKATKPPVFLSTETLFTVEVQDGDEKAASLFMNRLQKMLETDVEALVGHRKELMERL